MTLAQAITAIIVLLLVGMTGMEREVDVRDHKRRER
jgi:hypothetical protein